MCILSYTEPRLLPGLHLGDLAFLRRNNRLSKASELSTLTYCKYLARHRYRSLVVHYHLREKGLIKLISHLTFKRGGHLFHGMLHISVGSRLSGTQQIAKSSSKNENCKYKYKGYFVHGETIPYWNQGIQKTRLVL